VVHFFILEISGIWKIKIWDRLSNNIRALFIRGSDVLLPSVSFGAIYLRVLQSA